MPPADILYSEPIKLDLTPGRKYWYRPELGSNRLVGPYEIVGLGRNVHTHQELVAYQPVGGGQLWFAPVWDLAIRFVPVKEPEPVLPAMEKVAGAVTIGSGVQ